MLKIVSTKFTQALKEFIQIKSVNEAHSVIEGNLDETSANRAHLVNIGFFQVLSISRASVG